MSCLASRTYGRRREKLKKERKREGEKVIVRGRENGEEIGGKKRRREKKLGDIKEKMGQYELRNEAKEMNR